MERYMDEHRWYVSKFGLSEQKRKRIEELQEQIRALPPHSPEEEAEIDEMHEEWLRNHPA